MSDLTRKLHQLKSADYRPEWRKEQDKIVVTADVHGRKMSWTYDLEGQKK